MINSVATLRTLDGTADLYVRRCDPVRDENGGTLVLIHGAGEHAGRYAHLIERVVASGWTVLAPDLRGHGRSGGLSMHLETFDQYLEDLDLIWQRFQLDPLSTAVFAHSMGGLVAVRYAQTRPQRMRTAILSAPLLAFGVRVRLFKRAVGRICSVVAPTARFQTIVKSADITRNPLARAARAGDPLMRRSVTAGWYYSVRRALVDSLRDARQFSVPILLFQGTADRIVDPDWPAEWIQRIGTEDATLRMLPDHYHEVVQESQWEEIVSEMINWLDVRFWPKDLRPHHELLPFSSQTSTVIQAPPASGDDRRAA